MLKLGDACLADLHTSFHRLERDLYRMVTKKKIAQADLDYAALDRLDDRVAALTKRFEGLRSILAGVAASGSDEAWEPDEQLLNETIRAETECAKYLFKLDPPDATKRGGGSLADKILKGVQKKQDAEQTMKQVLAGADHAVHAPRLPPAAGATTLGIALALAGVLLDRLKEYVLLRRKRRGSGKKPKSGAS